jgi:predicted ATPase
VSPCLRVDPSPPCLLTLTGPGGSGKTRLALEVAEHLRTSFHGAVWFVPLQDLTEARLIPDKLLDSLRLPRSPQLEPMEQVVAFLSRQPSVLILDNFEHLVTDGAPLVQTLLEQLPTVTCLITSRQQLNLAGEQAFPVAPLPVPGDGRRSTGDREGVTGDSDLSSVVCDLSSVPSVRLFVDRAQAVRPDFQLTRTNADAVAGLCARLEGLPLAIELAAARAGVLTPAQMLARLSLRFELLATPRRGATPRHRSLRAALDWSFHLLSSKLQRFFVQLSVFQGGWTLEAAEAVCDEPKALHYLEQLRECSLVQATEAGGEMRFRLLETLREYGGEQFEPEQREAAAHRHASYYLALAERAEPELFRADQADWLDRLERDQDNLRAARAWMVASGRIQDALRLEGSLWQFRYVRADLADGLEQLRQLLSLPGAEARTYTRAKALNGAGALANFLGENETARCLHEASLTIGRELGDRWNIAFALTGLAMASLDGGKPEPARSLFEQGLTIWQDIGDTWGIAYAHIGLGYASHSERDYATARAHWRECMRARSERGDQWGLSHVRPVSVPGPGAG